MIHSHPGHRPDRARTGPAVRRVGPRLRPRRRPADPDQGQYRDRGTRCRPPPGASRSRPMSPTATRLWSPGCAPPGAVILGKTNLSEWANIRVHSLDLGLERDRRPDPQPLCARPQPVRLVERQRRRGCRRDRPPGHRHRDRRVDHLPRGDQRHRRPEADPGPGQPHPYRPDQREPGHGRADDRERPRGGGAARRDRRQRPRRPRNARGRQAQGSTMWQRSIRTRSRARAWASCASPRASAPTRRSSAALALLKAQGAMLVEIKEFDDSGIGDNEFTGSADRVQGAARRLSAGPARRRFRRAAWPS